MKRLNLCKKCGTTKNTFVFGYKMKFCKCEAEIKSKTKRAIAGKKLFLDNAFK